MTLEQMMELGSKPQQCEVTPALKPVSDVIGLGDYARSSGMTMLDCIKRKTCPICGNQLSVDFNMEHQAITWYWCSKNTMHCFERDEEAGTLDRIPM